MDWSAWGPTIVTLIIWVFFGGVAYSRLNSHSEHLNEHDKQLDEHTKDLTSQAIKIGMLEAWKEGYAAARSVYQPQHPVSGD